MTDLAEDKNIFHFMIELRPDIAHFRSENEHSRLICKNLFQEGGNEKLSLFISHIQHHDFSVWSEVLPPEMFDEFKEKGVFNAISVINYMGDCIKVFCCGLTQPDDKPITKCLEIFQECLMLPDLTEMETLIKNFREKEESTTH